MNGQLEVAVHFPLVQNREEQFMLVTVWTVFRFFFFFFLFFFSIFFSSRYLDYASTPKLSERYFDAVSKGVHYGKCKMFTSCQSVSLMPTCHSVLTNSTDDYYLLSLEGNNELFSFVFFLFKFDAFKLTFFLIKKIPKKHVWQESNFFDTLFRSLSKPFTGTRFVSAPYLSF